MIPSMDNQTILCRFSDSNSSQNNPTLNNQNQIIPEQFQFKHCKLIIWHTLIMLKLFLVRSAYAGVNDQTRFVQVTSLAVVTQYMLQLQAT